MRINADFSKRAVVHTDEIDWVPSPAAGVERKMLDRVGEEVARATSLVRYAPNSAFPEHTHDLGEEFLVLEGVFSDEHGDYPAGTYVRNPPGSSHAPFTKPGCTILVKLRQFDRADSTHIVIDTNKPEGTAWQQGPAPGVERLPLYEFGPEKVALTRFAPGSRVPSHIHEGGAELLVLEGSLSDEDGTYRKGSWLRNPDGSRHAPYTEEGALVYVKEGHLKGT